MNRGRATKIQRVLTIMAAVAVLTTSPAPAATINFTFTSGVSFTTPNLPTNNIECGATDPANINLVGSGGVCAAVDVTGAPVQTITVPGSVYYYIGAVQANEGGLSPSGITATEATPPHNFIVSFSIGGDVTQGFSLAVPVTTVVGNFPGGSFTFNQTSQSADLQDGTFLAARIWYNETAAGYSSGNYIVGSTFADKDTSFTWTDGNATGYLFLEMYYDSPEPATFVLIGSALVGPGLRKRQSRLNRLQESC